MGIFERFKGKPKEEGPKPPEEKILVPNFEVNEELEALVNEYVDSSTALFAITHDYGIDMNTDVNIPKIQDNPDLKEAAERYFKARERMAEIGNVYGGRLKEYLKPYANLSNPPKSPSGIEMNEWNRFRVAVAFDQS